MEHKHKSTRPYLCMDCRVDTSKIGEYYMVQDHLWRAVNPKIEGMLCVGCLEKQLGRELNFTDFTLCPVNLCNLFTGSDRLRTRMDASAMLHGLRERLYDAAGVKEKSRRRHFRE
jgi:hypothetical protein